MLARLLDAALAPVNSVVNLAVESCPDISPLVRVSSGRNHTTRLLRAAIDQISFLPNKGAGFEEISQS